MASQIPIPLITVVTPVFNEEHTLQSYAHAVQHTLFTSPEAIFRIVLVDDGSTDESWQSIVNLSRLDSRFCGVRLSRNFGSHIALSAGLQYFAGEALATLACDLQDPPEVILEFVKKWKEGSKIVWGKRQNRVDSGMRIWCSKALEAVLRRFALPADSLFCTGSFLLIDKQVVDVLSKMPEQNRVLFALVAWTGFPQAQVSYNRIAREHGRTRWNWRSLLKTAYDSILGFSVLPVRLVIAFGAMLFVIAIVLATYIALSWFGGSPLPGYTSIMFALCFFFGINSLLIGIMGEYLWRIYREVLKRPLFVVADATTESANRDK